MRRHRGAIGAVATAAICMTACATAPKRPAEAPATHATAKRPNIVFIVTDDQDVRGMELMPRTLRLLAQAGTTFSSAYVSSPICAPSRASILTGRYPHNTGVHSNGEPDGGFGVFYRGGAESNTIATRLRDAGYRTALIGKYINDYPRQATGEYVPPGWDEWNATTSDAAYFDFLMNQNGSQHHFEGADAYSTDVIRDLALDFLKRMGGAREPFFLYIATIAPHFPSHPAPRHRGEFPEAKAPRVPSFNEADVSDKPRWVSDLPPLGEAQIRQIDKLYRNRLQSMLAVDELVESLVGTLQATGELDNTYIFFTSDNGFQQGEHRFQKGKGLSYEESIHVPLIVRGPKVPAGQVLGHLVSNVDLYPTWLQLAGAPEDKGVDGRSMASLLSMTAPAPEAWRQSLYSEFLENNNEELPRFWALRTERWSYAEYDGAEAELYDMRSDPYQLENLASRGGEALSSLKQRLAAMKVCAANCR
jgi:arylsulfatase A-like enzyme